MRSASGGPRVLLRRLRETMAEQVSAQERLDKIVVLIAANMVAEVCSCYVLRIDNTLELYATEGLNRDAVHRTVLNAHEGLVGLVVQRGEPAQPLGRAKPPGVLVPARNRRRNLPFVPRRADPARRQHARRAGGAEPRQAHLCRGRGRGAADHRHGAGGNDRLRRTGGAGAARRRAGGAAFPAQDRRDPLRRHRARPCRAARAARRHHQLHRRRPAEGNQEAGRGADQAARRSRPHAGARRRRRGRRAPRRAGSLPHVRQRPRLVAQAARGGRHRPHRRSRRRARAVRHPRAHAALDRSLSARPPARSRRPRPSPDAAAGRTGSRAVARAAARERHPDRARDGPGGAARLRPQAAARPGAGGRHRQLPRLDRGARARHSRRRRSAERARHRRSRRRHHRRRHLGLDLCPPLGRDRIGLCRAGAVSRAAAGAICRAARHALRHQGRPDGRTDDQCRPRDRPAAYRRHRQRRHRAVPHRVAVHGRPEPAAHLPTSSRSIAPCSMPPAPSP